MQLIFRKLKTISSYRVKENRGQIRHGCLNCLNCTFNQPLNPTLPCMRIYLKFFFNVFQNNKKKCAIILNTYIK